MYDKDITFSEFAPNIPFTAYNFYDLYRSTFEHSELGRIKKIGGDTGYAETENRDWCQENGIQTSFVRRGRPVSEKKEQDFVRQELGRVRATAMEGSFGTQKEHYNLRRVKARRKETEIMYIFFGIHTANVVQLADRIVQKQQAKAA